MTGERYKKTIDINRMRWDKFRACHQGNGCLVKTIYIIALSALNFVSGHCQSVLAQNNSMPPPAPSFRAAPPQDIDQTMGQSAGISQPGQPGEFPGAGKQVFTVQPKSAGNSLTGKVDQWDANASMPNAALPGAAQYLIQTAPLVGSVQSHKVTADIFRNWLARAHPQFALTVSRNDARALLEVKGAFDKSAKTIDALGIPYQQIGAGGLSNIPLDYCKVMVINCAGNIPRDSWQRVRDFVARGGYLLTTDWALDHTVQKAFPGFIAYDNHDNRDSMYDAEYFDPDPVLGAAAVSNARWKMDRTCHMLKILRPDIVRKLVVSRALANEDRQGGGVLACVFPFGRGYVMHLVGHFENDPGFGFFNNLPDPAPVIGIALRQAIASNFIVAGLTGQKIPTLVR